MKYNRLQKGYRVQGARGRACPQPWRMRRGGLAARSRPLLQNDAMGCPVCGGAERVEAAPGVYVCQTLVEVGFNPTAGPVGVPIMAPCGHEYQESSTAPVAFCKCGMGAIARCVECGAMLCLRHTRRDSDWTVRCKACAAKLAAQEAEREKQRAADIEVAADLLAQKQIAELLAIPEPQRLLKLLELSDCGTERLDREHGIWVTLPAWYEQVAPELDRQRWPQNVPFPNAAPLIRWFIDHAAAAGAPPLPPPVPMALPEPKGLFSRRKKGQVPGSGVAVDRSGAWVQKGCCSGLRGLVVVPS